jgi:hypothetical protein
MFRNLRSLSFAAALSALLSSPALAVVAIGPPASDFSFTETPLGGGNFEYTIDNNSTGWYIWAFAITNPLAAASSGANAATTQTNWDAGICTLGASCQAGADSFVYNNGAGADDFTHDIAPGTSNSNFTFNVAEASVGYFQVVNVDGVLANVPGVSSSVPEPSTWALMLLGFAGLGYAGYRRTVKRKAALPA